MVRRMHDDQLDLDTDLVRRLLRHEFPQWADLPLSRVDSPGTVNAMFRLGEDRVVRMPFVPAGASDIEHEATVLPRLAPSLRTPIPRVLGAGTPGADYPYPWLVLEWIAGENPVPDALQDAVPLASDLAAFLVELRGAGTADAPAGGRAGTLHPLDAAVRSCLDELAGFGARLGGAPIDIDALTASWHRSLAAPPWHGAPVWTHGDLLPGNVLVAGGRLCGVLDFAVAGVGDPACDMMAAWSILPADARAVFRAELGLDEASWARGRGWALAQAVIALPYYWQTNIGMASTARRVIRELGAADPLTP